MVSQNRFHRDEMNIANDISIRVHSVTSRSSILNNFKVNGTLFENNT